MPGATMQAGGMPGAGVQAASQPGGFSPGQNQVTPQDHEKVSEAWLTQQSVFRVTS